MTEESRRSTVIGIFESRVKADEAVAALRSSGFRDDQIGTLARDQDVRTDATPEIAAAPEETAGEQTAHAAVVGGITGGVVGALGVMLLPGIGPIIAGGILAAAIGGVVIGAATGGVIGTLTDLGVPQEAAHYYDAEFQAGRTLVMVKSGDRSDEAQKILHQFGAYEGELRAASSTRTGEDSAPNDPPLAERWESLLPHYRAIWQQQPYGLGERWEDHEPATHFGYDRRQEAQKRDMSWSVVEPDVRHAWEDLHPHTPWARVRDDVRTGWEGDTSHMATSMSGDRTAVN